MNKSLSRIGAVVFLLGAVSLQQPRAAESAPTPTTENHLEQTNAQETLRAFLQLQEQIHSAQLAIEQTRRDADLAATENAKQLRALETLVGTQRLREFETMQSSNRAILRIAGMFAAVGVIAMLMMAFFQWRAINGLVQLSSAMPTLRAPDPRPTPAALGPGENRVVTVGPAEQSNLRLLGALERLEKRIYELEHTAPPPLREGSSSGNGCEAGLGPAEEPSKAPNSAAAAGAPGPASAAESSQISALLEQGHSRLELNDAEGALACFDRVLQLSPGHAEALVKKGTALERLRKFEESLGCYDQAIIADGSLTIAYLCKGGLFNRMERFSEALECYEKALQTQERRGREAGAQAASP
jgi:tetratricopeptide (TPR) repeat protein